MMQIEGTPPPCCLSSQAATLPSRMGEHMEADVYEEVLLDYEEDDDKAVDVGIRSSVFRDFLLKPELLRAIQDREF